jgi:hypothetical protein
MPRERESMSDGRVFFYTTMQNLNDGRHYLCEVSVEQPEEGGLRVKTDSGAELWLKPVEGFVAYSRDGDQSFQAMVITNSR